MKYIPLLLLLTSCTWSVTMMHSVGSTDDIEESQTASPNVSPNVSVPISGVSIPENLLPTIPKGMIGPAQHDQYVF